MEKKYTYIDAATISSILAIVSITAMTVYGEFHTPLNSILKYFFHHHWVGKSIVGYGVFAVTYLILCLIPHRTTKERMIGRLWQLFSMTILAICIVSICYIVRFLHYSTAF